ncbi:unnamed protein product [Penicillium salamii]|uniref:Uncharacterized protein n=1 Tax=Penicillium salamii TaxID=1612424 RepID=A0A9W4JDM2_9EURO|nr:unnamed protein product [Penicillium salamii]
MPLAIIQAAGYIVHRAPRCSVSQYLEKCRKSDRSATKLLEYEAGHLFRDWEAKNSILVTWQISFDYIRQNLLQFYNKTQNDDSNSQEIAIEYNNEDTNSTSKSNIDYNFEDDIATLRDF